MFWLPLLGAGLGALKGGLDASSANSAKKRKNDANALSNMYSQWTGNHYNLDRSPDQSVVGNALLGGATGALMANSLGGSGIGNAMESGLSSGANAIGDAASTGLSKAGSWLNPVTYVDKLPQTPALFSGQAINNPQMWGEVPRSWNNIV